MVVWSGSFERELQKLAVADLDRRATNVRNEAWALESRRLNRRTGRYNRSVKVIKTGLLQRTIRNEAPYALALELGTGIYGPSRRPIKPKNGTRLRFTVNGRVVFARSVKGTPPRRILTDALKKAKP